MKIIKIFLPIVVLLILTQGCGIYTKYERPEIPVADSLYNNIDSISVEDTISIAKMSWREMFTDTKLQMLIEKGLNANTDLKLARLKVQETEAVLQASKLSYIPSVSLGADGRVGSFDGKSSSPSYSVDLSATWEVDIFGKLTNEKRQAFASYEESRAYEQAVMTQVVSAVASSYYQLLMLDRQLEISKSTLDIWENTIITLEALKGAGMANETAVLQAKANKVNLEEQVLTIQMHIQKVENALSTLLYMPPQHISRTSLGEQSFPDNLSIGLPVELLSNRPDVRQAEFALQKAFYGTNASRSAFYPSLNLSGVLGWTNDTGVVVNPGGFLLNALGSLVAPLFNKGKNNANLKIAKAKQEAAAIVFQQSLLDAGKEVNDALIMYQTALKHQVLTQERIEHLEEAVNKTKLLMKHSSVNYLEVLTAEQSLLAAQMQQAQNSFDEINGVICLYHSLGGGVE